MLNNRYYCFIFSDLSRNEISVIEGLIFSELTNLKSLILRKNIIEDLRAGAFFNLRNLLSLYVFVLIYILY